MEPYVLRATAPIFPFGMKAGDYVVIDLALPVPVSAVRIASRRRWDLPPNYGLILLLLEGGDLIPASASAAVSLSAIRLLALTG